MSLPAKFWNKTAPATDCLRWTGAVNSKGYGCFAIDGVSHLAHRVAWEDAHGPIPEGMTIDHVCRVRNCVNVEHMEVVTVTENTRRKKRIVGDNCKRGHALTEIDALYIRANGITECRQCIRDRKAADRIGGAA